VRRNTLLGVAVSAGLAVIAASWPADAYAQRAGSRGRSGRPAIGRARSAVAVRPQVRVFSRPVYRSVYSPFYSPFYGSFYGSFGLFHGYPYYGQYPYPYPHPYSYRYDDRAELRIQVTPRDAEVFVDGYFAGLVDDFDGFAQRLRVEPGEHEITIYREGYRTWREQVRVRPRQSLNVRQALEPLPAGSAPEPRPSAAAGSPAQARGREGERRAYAAPAERGLLGSLSIRVQPADAEVWIDGERWNRPEGEDRLVIDLPEGSHRIEVRREGRQPYSTAVNIRRGEGETLNVTLR
jgi:hypothetical protein